jgi:hypothetical protein
MADARVRTTGSTRDAVKEFFAAERRNGERIQKFDLGLTDDDELPPYVHQDYPKSMYAPDGATFITAVAANAKEERDWIDRGYFASYAEYLEALEAVFEPEEDGEDQVSVGTAQPPKRSHKKKPAAA